MRRLPGREIIFEFRPSGDFMQVCAVDTLTGIEVSITTPVRAAQSDQRQLALQKLENSLQRAGIIPTATTERPADGAPIETSTVSNSGAHSGKRGFLA
jgi:hypothetical protein